MKQLRKEFNTWIKEKYWRWGLLLFIAFFEIGQIMGFIYNLITQ